MSLSYFLILDSCKNDRIWKMGQASSSSSSSFSPCTTSPNNKDLTQSLPDECLVIIFGKLRCLDRNSCSLVCKRWFSVDSKSRNRLVLLSPSEMSSSLPCLLSRFSSVSSLSLKCSRKLLSIDDHSLSKIPIFLSSLKKLKLKGCIDISDNGLEAFSEQNPILLSKISLASCGFGARGLNSLLRNCPSLQHLTLKRLRKLDAHNDVIQIDCNNKLERLCLKDLHNARIFVSFVSSLKALNSLVVCRSSGNWDKVLQSLNGSVTSISEIRMENVQMGDTGLLAISSTCPSLQVLQLTRTCDCTDEGLSAIANSCKNLAKLHVDAWTRFGGRSIGDEGLLSVAENCFKLQELVLMGIPVTSSSLTVLASNCRTLERLALCNTDSVGDSEMGLIASKLSALKKLCIKNCPISDIAIEAISEGCPNLVKLKVKRCRGISQGSVQKLRKHRNELIVSVDSIFHGQRTLLAEEQEQQQRSNQTNATSVVCSSRSALFLRSRFQNAGLLGRRRPNS